MPQTRKSKISSRKYRKMRKMRKITKRQNKKTLKFRKHKIQYGGMTLVPFTDLQPGTEYYIESKDPRREAKPVRRGQSASYKIQKLKGVFVRRRIHQYAPSELSVHNFAVFSNIQKMNPTDEWPCVGTSNLCEYEKDLFNFYLPVDRQKIEDDAADKIFRRVTGDPTFTWEPTNTKSSP